MSAMTNPATGRRSFLTQVTQCRHPCREHFELTVLAKNFPAATPGQFVQVLCRDPHADFSAQGPMLRRPFSIAGMRGTESEREIDLLGRVVGPGTAWLAARKPGDVVDILGPIGRGFSMPPNGHTALLVAGGVGLPPIRWLGEFLRKNAINCVAFYGALQRDLLPILLRDAPATESVASMCVEEFARHGIACCITTDDGSCGMRGRVTDALAQYLSKPDAPETLRVYACGPEPMLHGVAKICSARGIVCEVAMERVMGCGMGTCQSCVIPVFDRARAEGWRYVLCCNEGPVFDAATVQW